MNARECYECLNEQEKELRFQQFTNQDAWELGKTIVEMAESEKLPIAVDIVINGYQVFRYGFQGTNDYNEIWLTRKRRSVTTMGCSTLKLHYMRQCGEEDIYENGHLNPAEYAAMGGGFPIYAENVGLIGVLAVSGLHHIEDHNCAVRGLMKYLGKEVRIFHKEDVQ